MYRTRLTTRAESQGKVFQGARFRSHDRHEVGCTFQSDLEFTGLETYKKGLSLSLSRK